MGKSMHVSENSSIICVFVILHVKLSAEYFTLDGKKERPSKMSTKNIKIIFMNSRSPLKLCMKLFCLHKI